ncbi:MAG: polyprenyl synthetase family protein [Clostridia bacterium]|nr:polyprenyl synthetase family protein [Clostridia bacterium]
MKLKEIELGTFLSLIEKEFEKTEGIYSEMEKYVLLNAGKRLRPSLMFLVCKGINPETELSLLMPAALSIESIHNYSLIHDDLPCMDDDDIRRGKPSAHIKFGEANAVLLGDRLLSSALKYSASVKYESVRKVLADAALKMLDGQYVDVNKNSLISENDYLSMYDNKTGALIYASVVSGYLIASEDFRGEAFPEIESLATSFGRAFQLYDDLSDHDEASMYKFGEETVKKYFDNYSKKALDISEKLGLYEVNTYINKIFNSKM